MKVIPNSVTRFGHRSLLKLNKNSPTILVVGGVIGFTATVVMAARATRHVAPIVERHKKERAEIGHISSTGDKELRRDKQTQVVEMYYHSATEFARVYGPTIAVGTISAACILSGHKILKTRHVATMAAYSGLMDQFASYRGRVARTLGETAERDIYNGAHGEYVEDPDHKGEYTLQPKYDGLDDKSYLRPWFDETNVHWTKHAKSNYLFLKGVQQHMNNILQIRGHVFLHEVLDALRLPRTPESIITGWVYGGDGDDYVDFGFMVSDDPHTVAFRNELETTVQLNFNVDGVVWDKI